LRVGRIGLSFNPHPLDPLRTQPTCCGSGLQPYATKLDQIEYLRIELLRRVRVGWIGLSFKPHPTRPASHPTYLLRIEFVTLPD
ncbi:hypothetical protein PIB30_092131, partial [Stylosanthes scabra]|nr:hypothetical protein [Stylosanthes scabra]